MRPSGVVDRLLAERIGLDPSTVGPGLIDRGVRARMAVLGLHDIGDYERALAGPGEEFQELVEEVVVPESWFFRDARPFESLRQHAQSGWVVDPSRPPLTVLSLPCAGGEEPYSIAITLLEAGLPPGRFRVDAVDVSARSLSRAIAGVYGPNSFRNVDPAIRSRHFREQGSALTVDPAVRSTVRFHQGNLLDPALLADRPSFDVVFCRNLLIYLDSPARLAASAALGRLLVDGGLLYLGHADRVDHSPGSPFRPSGDRGCFSYCKEPVKSLPPRVPIPAREPTSLRRPIPPAREAAGRASVSPLRMPEDPGEVRPAPHVKVVEPSPSLEAARKLADEGHYDEALKMAERAVAEPGTGARAFTLLGMIYQAAGDRVRAEGAFHKAVYLDGQDDEALLALALLARRRGDVAAESAYRRRLERVRARKGAG